jgi:hypothetical protein
VKTQQLTLLKSARVAAAAGLGLAALGSASAAFAAAPPGRTVAYVIHHRWETVYQSKDKDGNFTKEECPDGVNEFGAIERFLSKFPKDSPRKFTLEETVLAAESQVWAPKIETEDTPFLLAGGKIGPGLNLDGKVDANDWTTPDGKAGVDNEFFRATGCMIAFREGSSQRLFHEEYLEFKNFNRIMFVITEVDDLENDNDVTITTYRGMDRLQKDAMGKFQADTTQRVDLRWGVPFISKGKAKIVNGTLITTVPADEYIFPSENHSNTATDRLRSPRFELKLEGEHMEGLMGGYLDVETTFRAMNRRFGTHQISYDRTWSPALYKVMRRLADGYPDPVTGENTAISAAIEVKGVRVHALFPDNKAPDVKVASGSRDVAENTRR